MVKRLLAGLFCSFLIINALWANDLAFNQVETAIKKNAINGKALVSISVRDVQNAQVLYEKNSSLLLHPASSLKAFTSTMALEYLGPDYEFETAFYEKGETLYLKLSADPLMDEKLLMTLVSQLRVKEIKTIKSLIIDDSVIDEKSWGTGWMWDDNTNPYMPQISAYNLNHNLINIKIFPQKDQKPLIVASEPYSVQIVNKLKNSDKTDIKLDRKVFTRPNLVVLQGEVSQPTTIVIPTLDPQSHFIFKLEELFNKYGIVFNPDIKFGKVPYMAQKEVAVKHTLKQVICYMNKQSDNLSAEVVLKHVGAKYSDKSGSTEDGLAFFEKYYNKQGIDTSELSIVDASGASHNDLLSTDWMTKVLSKSAQNKYFDIFLNSLAMPLEEGTLKNRLPEFKDNLKAKTGTNAGISSLTGYLTTKSSKKICFAIIIQNFKGNSTEAKKLEDEIIRIINTAF